MRFQDLKPSYAPGDHVKVESPGETTSIGEWMWALNWRSVMTKSANTNRLPNLDRKT